MRCSGWYQGSGACVKYKRQYRLTDIQNILRDDENFNSLEIDGQTVCIGEGSNRYGTVKIFDSQKLTDQQIYNYAQELAGDTPLKQVKEGVYAAKLKDGTTINLRSISSSQEETGARWTIDIEGNEKLGEVARKFKTGTELKFR